MVIGSYLQFGAAVEVLGRRPTLKGGKGDVASGQGRDVTELWRAHRPRLLAGANIVVVGQSVRITTSGTEIWCSQFLAINSRCLQ